MKRSLLKEYYHQQFHLKYTKQSNLSFWVIAKVLKLLRKNKFDFKNEN